MKEFIDRLGLGYPVNSASDELYSTEFKNMLDRRYEEYLTGNAEIVSEKESSERIKNLLASQK